MEADVASESTWKSTGTCLGIGRMIYRKKEKKENEE
jgi:hypothetical protein